MTAACPDVPDPLVARLRAAGCVFAEEEAALLHEAAGTDLERLESMVARRVAGEPLEPLLGWVEVAGVRVLLDPGVFVPRQRSALLVDVAARGLAPGSLVVDLCCGCGLLGVAVAARVADLEVHAADLDPAAVANARRNLPPERVHHGDLYDALPAHLRGRVDLLVVNAPYVPSAAVADLPREARDHEPLLALDGGADGVDLHRRVGAGAPGWLSPGGRLVVETSRRQATLTADAVRRWAVRVEVHHDEETGGCAVEAWRGAGADPSATPSATPSDTLAR